MPRAIETGGRTAGVWLVENSVQGDAVLRRTTGAKVRSAHGV